MNAKFFKYAGIAASVLLITAQRLARKLCENCKTPADYPREAMLKAGFKPEDLDGNWKPFRAVGTGTAVLRGSLAPGGAVVKQSAASPRLLRHRGPAMVFEDVDDYYAVCKDDDLDAISAARAALHGRRVSIPKSKDGAVESLRVLRVTRQTAIRARPNALQLLRMTIVACHVASSGLLGLSGTWPGCS